MDQNELKKLVGEEASKWVKDGMTVGLGTGSTVKFMVDALARRIKNEHLSITGVVTSNATAEQANALNIPLKSVDEVAKIDLTIDGADEISRDFQGIKGGGAALLFEKIVAVNSRRNLWIVDQSKLSERLGSFPLPVEVIPYGSKKLFSKFAKKGYAPTFRLDNTGQLKYTDSNNLIIDLHLKEIEHPHTLAADLSNQVGVVEHGLFLDMVNTVIVGYPEGPKVLTAR
ncbi:ribose-5-phosphate isomerase RpiA [Liquorilactobacillus capillatus]|uniref:Ribose-5-phosphate isomerase A n=1 Tax=Liquorilactobacillus capillatus DSM 19910 TaxID=1423731 RepID=A0A0R1MF29_9LACO|nr:ribose-5-phosphate isomerase RpiA [Liquorilactobacillus capillatus]KRL02851.1 ribose-5-phosphate isomerase A [Liquorilactobacillus capillatus DSM 19910]